MRVSGLSPVLQAGREVEFGWDVGVTETHSQKESECLVKEEHLAKVPGGEGILRPKEWQQSWEEARAYPGQVGQEKELKYPSTCRK